MTTSQPPSTSMEPITSDALMAKLVDQLTIMNQRLDILESKQTVPTTNSSSSQTLGLPLSSLDQGNNATHTTVAHGGGAHDVAPPVAPNSQQFVQQVWFQVSSNCRV